MGRGVAESRSGTQNMERGNTGARRTDVLMYQHTEPFTMGGVMYLKTTVLTFR